MWLAYSGCLVALTLVSSTIVSEILPLSAGIAGRVVEGAMMIAVLTVPVAVAVAVLKYRLCRRPHGGRTTARRNGARWPTTAGTFAFTIKATDGAGDQATKTGSITVAG
jgi:hypothetical protein